MDRSKEFYEGYNCQMERFRNPYKGTGSEKERDWDHGWLARFYGETI
jgi:hypothetical protein